MIQLQDITLRRGTRVLVRELNALIPARARVGIAGANGCGKSSLLAAIRGDIEPDAGDIILPNQLLMASVGQETPAVDTRCINYVLEGDKELQSLQAALSHALEHGDSRHIAEINTRLEAIDAYTATARASRILSGLGFSSDTLDRPVRSFSGGWRMRLNLAQALVCRSELLLLDEPTNHLDLDAIIWLETWLRSYPGTLLLVSHDRDFLDSITDHILHIENGRATLYSGNYSRFELLRAQALARQHALFERQQREIAHVRSFVERFRAKATKARQAQSRIKALERLEAITLAHVDMPFNFEFRVPTSLPNPLLQLEKGRIGYGQTIVVDAINLSLEPGNRIGLLGPNGAGKSTLMKALAGELALSSGIRSPAAALKIGYFAQHQLEQLDDDRSPLSHVRELDPRAQEQSLRDYLGAFGFSGDAATQPIAPLSGGEKARLVLALVTYSKPNLLLLDEPTNHLDLEMRQALTLALQDFTGCMVIVSHDRHLLRTVADELWLVAKGRVQPFEGDLDDYAQWLLNQSSNSSSNKPSSSEYRDDRRTQRRQDAERRQQLQPLRKRVADLEIKLAEAQARRAEIQQLLATGEVYAEGLRDRLKSLLLNQAEIEKHLQDIENQWLEASEALEAAERAIT